MRTAIVAGTVMWSALGAGAPGQEKESPPAAAMAASGLGKRIDEAVQRETLGAFWGAVLVCNDGGVVLAKGYGLANDELRPIGADTLFDVGSVSKQFTAAAVLRLQDQGKLSVLDPVSKFFDGLPAKADEVKVLELLNHTSGMRDVRALQRLDFPDRDAAVRKAFESEFVGEPGEAFDYCNAGYVVLAAVVEKASGKRFEAYVREEVFGRAAMAGTGFIDGEGLDLSRATLRLTAMGSGRARRKTILQDGWGWGLRGAGGVVTSLTDLAVWDRALSGEAVLSAAAKEQMFWADPMGYGCGWMVETTKRGTRRAHHGGRTRGYTAQVSRFLDEGWFVAVLAGEDAAPPLIEAVVLEEIFPPERTEAGLFLGGLDLNEHKNSVIEGGLRLIVQRGEPVRLLLVEEAGAKRAELVLSRSRAAGLGAELRRLTAGAGPADGSMTAVLSALPYEIGGNGAVALPERVEVTVQPLYRTMDEGGKELVDRRPTLMVLDREGRFIPLIVRMDAGVAARLAVELEVAGK